MPVAAGKIARVEPPSPRTHRPRGLPVSVTGPPSPGGGPQASDAIPHSLPGIDGPGAVNYRGFPQVHALLTGTPKGGLEEGGAEEGIGFSGI